ncbi:MAG TPA: chromosomal replication initiator protein DnaA [Opitutaceae bacterium]|nr:chromosomal replication initiator protein DnaA [Opitutaceae bacterium]
MSSTTTSSNLWETVKCDLKGLFPDEVFQMWFEPISCLEATDDSLVLNVPNEFAAIWVHDNYLDLITQRVRLTSGRMVSVTLRKGDAASAANRLAVAEPAKAPARPNGHTRRPKLDERCANPANLNPRNTFENFVVGPTNQLAHAASIAVAQAPAQAYNPLFIYGDPGLGKTHLMHAVGHQILRNNPDAKVAYLSSEKFTNEFIHAIQENTLTKFRQRYRHVDVLLIDDIHFLAGKERIQEEFFHTFNELFEAQKQIYLSSDRPANEIQKLESRLVSRFQWGLVVDLQTPDLETRVAILRTKAASLKANLPAEVINFIAQHISKNVRRLEGALIKVASYAALTNKHIDIPTVEMLLKDMLIEQAQNQLTIDTIQKRVADYYQLRHSDMLSKRRPNNIAIPRQIAMYLARILTKHSLAEIGENFGGRDHGTVIHACKSVETMMEQSDQTRTSIEFLKNQLSK